MANIEAKTFGLELVEDDGIRWIILPEGWRLGQNGEATRGRVAVEVVKKY